MSANSKKVQLEKGYYFSPGFYMGYWINCIEKYYPKKVILSHVKLKQHREVWIGAILAAWQTKLTGTKYYVGIPDREPPDVELVRFVPSKGPSGGEGTGLEKIGFEITRCSIEEGETLIGQIIKKNTAAYSGMSLAVYTYGGSEIDFNLLQTEIDKLTKIYPMDIIVVGPVIGTKAIKFQDGTFGITRLFPNKGQDLVNVQDQQAFFMQTNVMAVTGRGVKKEVEDLGYIELMPPEIIV